MLSKISFSRPLSRFLDSLGVLFFVSILTFLIARLNISLQELDWIPLLVLVFLGAVLICFQFARRKLHLVGLLLWPVCVISLPYLLPSIGKLGDDASNMHLFWAWFCLPLLWTVLLFCFWLRSYQTRERLFLNCFSFLVLWLGGSHLLTDIAGMQFKYELPERVILKSGDPLADLRLNPSVSPAALKREKERLGLDRPVWRQYLLWLDGLLVRGDLGLTQQGEPVASTVMAPLRNTLMLNITVIISTWLLAIPLGVVAALNRGRWLDKLLLSLSSFSLSTPAFLLAIFALSIAARFGWKDIGGLTSLGFYELPWWAKMQDIFSHLLIPLSILTFVSIGGLIRQMRGNLLDVLNEDYIKAALARGIPERTVFWSHALQNALNPLITLLGFEFASLVSGAALTEMILSYPGIGALTLEAARKMDINLIMFNLLLGTIMLILGNALADLLLAKADPRVQKNS